jgi:hypothetical protein
MTGAMYELQTQSTGGGTVVRQEQSTSYATVKSGKAFTLEDLKKALATIGEGAKSGTPRTKRPVADRRGLVDKIPWDTDTAMLRMLNHPNHSALIREHLTNYLTSIARSRFFAQISLTGIFSQRYLASHIWSEGRVK